MSVSQYGHYLCTELTNIRYTNLVADITNSHIVHDREGKGGVNIHLRLPDASPLFTSNATMFSSVTGPYPQKLKLANLENLPHAPCLRWIQAKFESNDDGLEGLNIIAWHQVHLKIRDSFSWRSTFHESSFC